MTQDKRYTQVPALHARLGKGGWMWVHTIMYEGQPIGSVSTSRATRSAPQVTIYILDDQEYDTAAEFMAAHQKSLT